MRNRWVTPDPSHSANHITAMMKPVNTLSVVAGLILGYGYKSAIHMLMKTDSKALVSDARR